MFRAKAHLVLHWCLYNEMLYDASCIQILPDASSARYKKSHATKSYRLNRPL